MKNLITLGNTGMANLKKVFVVLSFFWIASNVTNSNDLAAQSSCCPEFFLKDAVEICPPQGACGSDGTIGGHAAAACKLSYHEYTVYPNDQPMYTYTWTITGGTPASITGNPNVIQWGSGSTGFIKVVISNIPSGGTCVDSVFMQICLIDGPQADFTLSPDTVCQNTPVTFTNTSLGGSTYFWDFGDGTTSTLANPPAHSYSLPGNYTVKLKVTDMGAGQWVVSGQPPRETLVPCGCSDTISKQVVVLSGQGPIIEKDCCFGTVCPGDTTTLCTPQVCTTYNWIVTNGTIISPPNSSCIQVKWNATYTGPTTVSLTVPGCGSAPCIGTTTIDIPVLYPNLPIVGPTTLCVGASGTYTLPTLPGTYYTWTVNGPFYTFNQVDRNSPSVNITFGLAGTYWVRCDYNNPLAGCNGVDSIQVDVKPVYSIFGDNKVCEMSTISYNGIFGPANWLVTPPGPIIGGTPGNPVTVTWTTPGTYYLKAAPVNASAFCNDTAVMKVDVIAKPILNNIIGPDSICPGKNLTYSISSNTSGSQFIWQITGGGTGQILSYMGADKDSIVVKFNAIPPGPWQLSVYQEIEINPGVFCQSLTKVKNVYPFLAPNISGQINVCVDDVEGYTAGGSNLSGNFQWTISPASQGTIQSGQGSNSVQVLWHGPAGAATLTVSTCSGSDQIIVNILNPPVKPIISPNGPLVYCLPNLPVSLQLSVPNIYSTYQWYHNGLLFGQTTNTYSIPNGTFTGAGIYIFSVVVSNGLCSTTSNIMIQIGTCGPGGDLNDEFQCDTIIDFSWNPNPACANQQVTFWAVPSSSIYSYAWNFGDLSTSFQTPTQHIYTTPGTYNVQLSATFGTCYVDTIKPVTINPLPSCNLVYPDTIFCPGDSLPLTACNGMSTYQWFKNGNPISGANGMTHYVKEHGEYWVEMSNSFGCYNNSDSLYIYMNSLPVAKITGTRRYCAQPNASVGVNLATVFNTSYIYSWSSNPPGATFSPTNNFFTLATVTLPLVLPVIYEFIVNVTDTITGCQNADTICVAFYREPIPNVTFLNACEGASVPLNVTPNNPALFSYLWSNGATTPSIIASSPGFYSVTVTNKLNGCFATANAGFIHPKPDLSLFPTGCDNICLLDTFNIYIPLALNWQPPLNTYPSAYPIINWYSNGNFVGSGENLAYSPTLTGNYQISVEVQNSFGCVDSVGAFCLSVDTTVTIIVSAETPCGCDSTISFNLVNTANEMDFYHFDMVNCVDTLTFCINNQETYDLVASNGIYIPNAIVNGVVNYPGGIPPFMIGDNGLCCFAYADSLFVKILAPITYSSDVVWDGKYYIDDNVIVTVDNGAVLDITTVDVVFGECAGIVFQDSAYLRATNSVFRPCNIDKTWKGLTFFGPGEFDNIINESTFKNAEVALYFQEGSDGVVSSNLFSNCNYGVRVEHNNKFDHPISDNHFVTEQFFPSWDCISVYPFVTNQATYGIYTKSSSRLTEQVSQNEFVNTWGATFPRTYGIFQENGGALISENVFTDMSYSVLIQSASFPTNVENNKISVNEPALFSPSTIYILNTAGPVIEVNNNKISNNTNQFNSYSAIYASKSKNVSIVNNEIDGFRFGIIGVTSQNFQISSNQINDCDANGIYFSSPGKNDRTYITCNLIKMRNYNNTRGIMGINMTQVSEVSSNCVTDCYTSMDFKSFLGATPLPLIRNNFLYNYNNVGINVQSHSGNIGTLASPGLNTLWSNDNSSVDINSTSNITVADNFGMFNISWPQVQITSNNPYHSTASCAHQIFNMPSQGNLNTNYICDHYKQILDPLTGGSGTFNLSGNYLEVMNESSDQFNLANMILATYENADIDLLNTILEGSSLSENEKAMLKYGFYYRNSDFVNAGLMLNSFNPGDQDEADLKALLLIDLGVVINGIESITLAETQQLEMIIDKESLISNYAISLLNNTSTYNDYQLEEISLPDVLKTSNIKRIESESTYLNIYPNPAFDKVYVELVHNNGENCKIELFDVSGKLVTDYTVNFVTGGIELDIRHLRNGFYFITLTDASSGIIEQGKMVKMKD